MNGTVISLKLDEEERELVQEILQARHRTMLMEISHTDHCDFKAALRKKAELLENVLSRFMVHA